MRAGRRDDGVSRRSRRRAIRSAGGRGATGQKKRIGERRTCADLCWRSLLYQRASLKAGYEGRLAAMPCTVQRTFVVRANRPEHPPRTMEARGGGYASGAVIAFHQQHATRTFDARAYSMLRRRDGQRRKHQPEEEDQLTQDGAPVSLLVVAGKQSRFGKISEKSRSGGEQLFAVYVICSSEVLSMIRAVASRTSRSNWKSWRCWASV